MTGITVWTEKGQKRIAHQAASISKSVPLFDPVITTQPYTETQYQYFEDIWSATEGGKALDMLLDFAFGNGVMPVMDLIDKKNKTAKQLEKESQDYQWVLDELMKIDNQDGVTFPTKFKEGCRLAKVFGRDVLAFEYGAKEIPDALKVFHPRDLGRPRIRDHDWSVSSVVIQSGLNPKTSISAEDMIYIENYPNNPIRRNIGYGYSDYHRVVGAARSIRRFIEYDSPEIVQSMWAGYGTFILRPQSKSPATDLNNLLGGLRVGGFNAISANPEDLKYEQVKLEAETEKLVELMSFFERLIIGNFGVPSALMGREEDTNMATLFGKIQLFVNGPVKSVRNWASPIAEKQWYIPNLDKIEKGLSKKIKIKAEFDPLVIESWKDSVDAVAKLQGVIPELPLMAKLKLLNLSQYKDDIEKAIEASEKEREDNPEEEQASDEEQALKEKNTKTS